MKHSPTYRNFNRMNKNLLQYFLTSTKLLITIGKIERGNLRILKRLMQTNAVRASSWLFLSMNKYVVKDIKVTLLMKEIRYIIILIFKVKSYH